MINLSKLMFAHFVMVCVMHVLFASAARYLAKDDEELSNSFKLIGLCFTSHIFIWVFRSIIDVMNYEINHNWELLTDILNLFRF